MFSKTPEEHISHVRQVITLLDNAGATLKLKRCKFFTDTIDNFGRIMCPRQSKFASHTTSVIRGLKALTSFTKLQSFLGLCNEFHRVVPSFVQLVAPLSRRFRKDQPAIFWATEHSETSNTERAERCFYLPADPHTSRLKQTYHPRPRRLWCPSRLRFSTETT